MQGRTRGELIEEARRAVRNGVSALLAEQNPDGSFPCLQREAGTPWRPCHPLFSTLSVLLAAGPLLPEAAISKGVAFVQGSRRSDRLWEFDPALGIPPDAD